MLSLVLQRAEPETRLDLLRRAPALPIKDVEREFLRACLARLSSRYVDEAQTPWQVSYARAAEPDVGAVQLALLAVRENRRALYLVGEQLVAQPVTSQAVLGLFADALLFGLAADDLAVPLYLRLGLCRYCQPLDGERFLVLLRQVAERGLLHSLASATAGETLRTLPIPRLPIADLDGLVERLGQHRDPALRYLSLVLPSAVAAPENGQRYTPARRARRARLAIATHDPAPPRHLLRPVLLPPDEEPEAAPPTKAS